MTAADVQSCLVEMFTDCDRPIPPWAYTNGQAVLDEMKELVEIHVDLG